MKSFFEKNDLDYQPETVIRREINPAGRSRAFINDTPVTLNQLKALSNQLVDVHSQHQTLLLNKHNFQLKVVDAFAEHEGLLITYIETIITGKRNKKFIINYCPKPQQSN